MRLTRETVLRAALDLLDEVGIDGLTTRRLAERLGVQSPTLYWHFKNKRALLDAMAHAMLEQHTRCVPEPGEDWRVWLRGNALSFRRALLSHRDGARVHAGTGPEPGEYDCAEVQIRHLCEAGFAPGEALSIMIALSRFIVGWVLEEQAEAKDAAERDAPVPSPSPRKYPLFATALEARRDETTDAAFEKAIGFFIGGLNPSDKRAPGP
ncbi:tetracycline resistance transcriptional repressor TetR [Mesorhizobium sp. RMAD-H1]|uniref:tetracycline resistance transcriptional repressor TetR n=1 Tax=Mesorhizobium sp. RMAD-H1 TaxID=2587065 RepID=UPI00161D3B28|nr:tetracycline resistance transcriptional repressor TetR [Mesorhizobium sp. RMAD-H1]MBB2973051.1 TetR/AcrR family tetracycline transcriptional repressor [Mesorhizobium sp. RMAD-H1]